MASTVSVDGLQPMIGRTGMALASTESVDSRQRSKSRTTVEISTVVIALVDGPMILTCEVRVPTVSGDGLQPLIGGT